MKEPAKTTAVDDAREPDWPTHCAHGTKINDPCVACIRADLNYTPALERKVAELEAQLRQEREAREKAEDQVCSLTPEAHKEPKMVQHYCDCAGSKELMAVQAQVAQLQTTVGQLREYAKHKPECTLLSTPNRPATPFCSCRLLAALATCPAPEEPKCPKT